MMYEYRGTNTVEAEIERLDPVKQQARRELKERRAVLEKLRRERRVIEALEAERRHVDAEIRHLSAVKALSEPVHGGEAGLIRAAAEAFGHGRRKCSA